MALIGRASGGGRRNMPHASGKSFKQGGRSGGVIRTKTITPKTFSSGYKSRKASSGMARHMAKLGKIGA